MIAISRRGTLMQVYLVQHGASKSEAEDPQRDLTDKGRGVVEEMAEHLAGAGISVDRIEHSDKLRARQTADILASTLKPRNGTAQVSGLAPNDDVTPMRLRLQEEEKNVMLVGHLPYLSRLLSSLLLVDQDRPLVEFRMGGVVCLERVENRVWRLLWALTPELLKAPSTAERAA
jgi:phosphohistidine phosphatase